jgi:hypothetical protein
MADMSEYADRIREIMQEAQNEMLTFDIIGPHFVIEDGVDHEVIW